MFKASLILAACLLLTGCVYYKQDAKGTRFYSFLKKADIDGLSVSTNGADKSKARRTGGDVDMLKALAEGAVSGAVKGAK